MTANTLPQVAQAKPLAAPASDRKGFWAYLTRPSDQLLRVEERRRARLLAALLVTLIPLGVLIDFLTLPVTGSTSGPFFFFAMSGSVLLIAGYVFSRSRFYRVGTAFLLLAITGMVVMSVLVAGPTFIGMLIYLNLSVLLASMLESTAGTIVTAVANVALFILIDALSPTYALDDILPYLSPFIIISILTVVFSIIRQQDLNQIEAQAADLAQAVEQAQAASVVKSQFLATMSHELRTPLNAIIGFSEVMLMGLAGELPERVQRSIERIHFNSEWLLKLIDDILDISKIEAGRIELERKPFDLRDLISDIEQNLKRRATDKGISLVTEFPQGFPAQVVGDYQRVKQVLTNLADNAVKFTDEGSVKIIAKRGAGSEVVISIADTGVGIPHHAQDIVFEKFRQIDGTSRRAYKGTGLGLAIVKELCVLMGGSIVLNSVPDKGSTFTVTLPLVEPERMLS